jgi:hypothetical protein
MEKAILFAVAITILFVVVKLLEEKYLGGDEPRPMKLVVRDAVIVFVASLAVLYVSMYYDSYVQEMLSFLTGNVQSVREKAMIFTGEPEF